MTERLPTPPGEILREEFMKPNGLNSFQVAKAISVPANRIFEILRNRRKVTADTSLRLAALFGTTPQFWMALQSNYDIALARDNMAPGILDGIKLVKPACSTN